MKQAFATLYGKAVLERGVLYVQSPYLPFTKTAFVQLGHEFLWLLWFLLRLVYAEKPFDYFVAGVVGVLVLSRIPAMHDKFFRRSYANRIPLDRITSAETIDTDPHGLHITVKLWLTSGRYKEVCFRKLENQHHDFTAALTAGSTLAAA